MSDVERLDRALLRLRRVDFISLDVEGAEALAVSTLDWRRLSVGVLISECTLVGCGSDQDRRLAETLARHGLRRVATLRSRHDIWNAAFVNDSWVGTYSRP